MQEFIKFCDSGEIEYNEKNNEVIITIKDLKLKFRKENSIYVHINYTQEELNEIINKCNFNKNNGEIEVLKMYNEGKSYYEISDELKMSVTTVGRRVRSVKQKIKMVEKW